MSSPLEQRPFGRTGERVTVIGLGGAALYKHSYELGLATVKHALGPGRQLLRHLSRVRQSGRGRRVDRQRDVAVDHG